MPSHEHKMKIFACENSRYLAEKIASSLGIELGRSEVLHFSDGEFQPSFQESVRGTTVFIVQSTFPPADNLLELLLMIDAAKRASAYEVIAIIPYFGWARQDRKDKPRVPIGAKLVANLLEASGCDRLMVMDLHADQIQGFFDIPLDHLYASSLFVDYIKNLHLKELAIASPDIGGAKRANAYSKYLGVPLVICHKTRAVANQVESMSVIGEVDGKNVVIIDDMADTAGTLTKCASLLKQYGAASVRAICTHPVFSGKALERIAASEIDEMIVTDTIPLRNKEGEDISKIKVLSVAGLYADTIRKVYNFEPISDSFYL